MEGRLIIKSHKYNLFLSILVIFLSSSILLSSVHSLAPAGTSERITKQQLLASLPPTTHEITTPTGASQLFLTSPSGKYSVFLLRRETSIGAGGFGSDFCYIQVQESGVSVWESECTPVSNVNTCSLVFSDAGLEIFDGSNSAWDNDVDGDDLETLELMDSGDMQIRDKDGELVWKASDNPIINQNCGSIGAPEMSPALPPFASPIHGDDDQGPFGQPAVNDNNNNNNNQAAAGGLVPQQPQLGVPEQHQNQQKEPTEELQLEPAPSHIPQLQGGGLNQPAPFSSALNHHEDDQHFGASSSHEQQQPLIDNTPFDSGSPREKQFKVGVTLLVSLVTLAFFG
ncbi:hypothetical protein BVC80_1831g87 [Macleaya cordata]|uniref:Bulb-type lectin domain n=1 Tax=Macleaya cordata TaxID=56857 RepID=A0A200R773_MACCD|nr:hypothetical protein BVC80_1831g87 [Macleaya cordata]